MVIGCDIQMKVFFEFVNSERHVLKHLTSIEKLSSAEDASGYRAMIGSVITVDSACVIVRQHKFDFF